MSVAILSDCHSDVICNKVKKYVIGGEDPISTAIAPTSTINCVGQYNKRKGIIFGMTRACFESSVL